MKTTPFLLLIFFISPFLSAQETNHQGTILDAQYGDPLPYVNIGVIGKNVGTVSDNDGNFTLTISSEYDEDSLQISMIGYERLRFKVADFKQQIQAQPTIELEPSIAQLDEIVIESSGFKKEKVLGNTTTSTAITGGFSENNLGNEVGIVMKIKKSPSYLKEFNTFITISDYDTVKFRLNVYDLKDGLPNKNLLKENIFITTTIKEGQLTVDLSEYNIFVEDDFFISLEWIEDLGEGNLYFPVAILGSPHDCQRNQSSRMGKNSSIRTRL